MIKKCYCFITVRGNDSDTQNPTTPNSLFYISSAFLSSWKEKRPKETRLDKRLDPFSRRLFRGLLNSFGLTASLGQATIQKTGITSLERDDGSYTGENIPFIVSLIGKNKVKYTDYIEFVMIVTVFNRTLLS